MISAGSPASQFFELSLTSSMQRVTQLLGAFLTLYLGIAINMYNLFHKVYKHSYYFNFTFVTYI